MKNFFLVLILLGAASFTRALGATLPLADPQWNERVQMIHQDLSENSELSAFAKKVAGGARIQDQLDPKKMMR